MRMKCMIAASALIGLSAVGAAHAGNELQFDVNSLTASANGVFGTGFTGSVSLVDDSNSTLTDMLINGTAQGIAAGQLGSFTGSITIVAGAVTGGSFTITDTSGASYTATIVNGSGTVSNSPGATGPFRIDGLTFNGTFAGLSGGTDFAGVDVTTWSSVQPLTGSFLQFKFGPDAQGVDTNTDIDIFAVVPLPTPVGLGVAGLVGIAGLRRRRA